MERMHIKFYLVAILLLGSRFVSGQVGSLTQVANPHSPDATALGRFVEMPVGHYTGLPDISIPIYNLEAKGMQVPISLSYHASGMKVKELPGSVGACWALNAGGVINRIVRGYPDSHTNGGLDYEDSQTRARMANAYTIGFTNEFANYERFWIAASTPGIFYEEMANNYNWERRDTEYDIFSFNFNGHTGQFTFDNQDQPLQLNGNDLKIEYDYLNFKITDENGIEYYFNAVEQDYDETAFGFPSPYITSWFVTKIRNPLSGEEILFTYKDYQRNVLYDQSGDGQQTFTRAYGNTIHKFRYFDATTRPLPIDIPERCDPYDNAGRATPPYSNNALFPDEITWGDKKIKFYGALNRQDLYKYKLDSIQVLSGTQVLKRIRLHTGYFNAAASRIKYRKLKLDSVRVGSELYKMEYFESVHGMGMPSIQTKGQDVWGYYNGEDENLMVPGDYNEDAFNWNIEYSTNYKIFGPVTNPYSVNFPYPNSTFRNPDAKYAQLGTLAAITYPTGGRSEFTYEGNTFGYTSAGGNIENDGATQFLFQNQYFKQCQAMAPIGSGTSYWYGLRNFVIHQDQSVQITGSLGMDPSVTYAQYQSIILVQKPTAKIHISKYNDATGVFDLIKTFNVRPDLLIGTPADMGEYLAKKALGTVIISEPFFMGSGRYQMYAEISGQGVHAKPKVNAQFDFKASDSLFYAGGLRIKNIRFDPGPSAQSAYSKSYNYHMGARSSGILEAPISNSAQSGYFGNPFYYPPTGTNLQFTCMYYDIYSEPLIPLGNSMGSNIGYGQVTETREDGSSTIYHHTMRGDGGAAGDVFIINFVSPMGYIRPRILTDNSWSRGLPKKIEYFNAAGQPVKRQFMDYRFDINADRRSISFIMTNVRLNPPANYMAGGTYFSVVSPSKALLVRDSTVQYSPEGNTFETVKYEYATARHYYPTKITRSNSLGDSQVEYRRYPQDFEFYYYLPPVTHPFSKGIKNLQDNHVLAPVIERYTESRRAGQPGLSGLSGEIVSFQQTLPLPDQVYQLEASPSTLGTAYSPLTATYNSSSMDSRYKLRGQFSSYDSKGNLGQYALQNGPTNSFIWDYSGQLMTASVQSAALSDIAFTSFEAENKGSWTYSGATVADATSPTGSRAYVLTGGNVVRTGLNAGTSYMLTYWAKSASAGNISGGAATIIRTNGSWRQYQRIITGVTAVTLTGTDRIDELRLYPLGAQLTTYTHIPLVGMSSQTDPTGRTVYYEYDSFQRLIAIKDMDGRVLDNYRYQYENL